MHNSKFQISLGWLVVPCQFYWHQISGSIAETDLKQKKWKYNFLSNASDITNPTFPYDATDHDPAHLKVWNKCLIFNSIESHDFLTQMSKQTGS